MTGKKSISIKHFLRISLAVMLLFLFIISTLYYLFIYTFSRDQFESSFQTFSESIEAQLDAQFRNVEHSVTQLSYFSNMQEILFSKKPLVYLNNISGCNQLWGYLKTSLPIITDVIITSPYGHTFYSGTTGKYRYQKFAEKIIQENKNMSREPFFLTIPPEDDSNQLPQLVYCFPVYNTLLSGYISDEYALGMALIDVNALVDLSSSEKYVGEIKAILYHDSIVYISREASQLEMAALYKRAQGKFRIDNVEFTCHTVMLEDTGMSMIDMVPTANLFAKQCSNSNYRYNGSFRYLRLSDLLHMAYSTLYFCPNKSDDCRYAGYSSWNKKIIDSAQSQ